MYRNRVLVYIDMDVAVECASPFKFEGSGPDLKAKFVTISALPWIRSFKCKHGGNKLTHGTRNVH